MICSVCQKNEAKVHVTQIVDDKMQKVDLCEECSKAKGVTDPKGFSLADLLLGLGASQEGESRSAGKPGDTACPGCGLTQTEFKKSVRFGCPQCYTAFGDGLAGMLKSMHKGVRHVGKVPTALKPKRDPADLLKALNRRLEKAVQAENFEEAAQLRDAIRALKQGASSPT
ncbi:MAG: UvrB/UvrC motif-containing protein [Limisphaerales bacterium]